LAGAASAAAPAFTLLRTHDVSAVPGALGFACAVVGDMRGTGTCEYAIGDPDDGTGGPGAGRVTIYSYADTVLFTLAGDPGDHLGAAVSSADVDGDGAMDLIAGAPGSPDVDPGSPGRVVIVFGGTPIGARPPLGISGTTPGGRFGAAVAGLYPYLMRYGAGVTPFVVGAPEANAGAGEVHWFQVGEPAVPAPFLVQHGDAAGSRFGAALANAGIVSQQTGTLAYDPGDLLVGAPGRDAGRGAAYLFLSSPPDTVPQRTWSGADPGDRLGASLAGGGMVHPEVPGSRAVFVIGAPGADVDGRADAGRAFAYSVPGPGSPDTVFSGDEPHAELGTAVSIVTYMTSLVGLLVASPGSDSQRGRLSFRSFAPEQVSSAEFLGEAAGDRFGQSLSNSGAVHRTPFCQFCDGAPIDFLAASPAHAGGGKAYLFGAIDTTTHVGAVPGGPTWPARLDVWPNPSTSRLRIGFTLERAAAVQLDVVDLAGRRIARVAAGAFEGGRHELSWTVAAGGRADASRAAGLYWVVLSSGGVRIARKVIVAP
jgi:hypothetical protein